MNEETNGLDSPEVQDAIEEAALKSRQSADGETDEAKEAELAEAQAKLAEAQARLEKHQSENKAELSADEEAEKTFEELGAEVHRELEEKKQQREEKKKQRDAKKAAEKADKKAKWDKKIREATIENTAVFAKARDTFKENGIVLVTKPEPGILTKDFLAQGIPVHLNTGCNKLRWEEVNPREMNKATVGTYKNALIDYADEMNAKTTDDEDRYKYEEGHPTFFGQVWSDTPIYTADGVPVNLYHSQQALQEVYFGKKEGASHYPCYKKFDAIVLPVIGIHIDVVEGPDGKKESQKNYHNARMLAASSNSRHGVQLDTKSTIKACHYFFDCTEIKAGWAEVNQKPYLALNRVRTSIGKTCALRTAKKAYALYAKERIYARDLDSLEWFIKMAVSSHSPPIEDFISQAIIPTILETHSRKREEGEPGDKTIEWYTTIEDGIKDLEVVIEMLKTEAKGLLPDAKDPHPLAERLKDDKGRHLIRKVKKTLVVPKGCITEIQEGIELLKSAITKARSDAKETEGLATPPSESDTTSSPTPTTEEKSTPTTNPPTRKQPKKSEGKSDSLQPSEVEESILEEHAKELDEAAGATESTITANREDAKADLNISVNTELDKLAPGHAVRIIESLQTQLKTLHGMSDKVEEDIKTASSPVFVNDEIAKGTAIQLQIRAIDQIIEDLETLVVDAWNSRKAATIPSAQDWSEYADYTAITLEDHDVAVADYLVASEEEENIPFSDDASHVEVESEYNLTYDQLQEVDGYTPPANHDEDNLEF